MARLSAPHPGRHSNRRRQSLIFLLVCAVALFGLFVWIQGWHDENAQASLLAGIIGLCLGSFANVVIWRLPVMLALATDSTNLPMDSKKPILSLAHPPSSCPRCGTRIAVWENVPVISYCCLKGRCSTCRNSISWRYPIVEAWMGASFAGLAWLIGPTFHFFAVAMVVWLLTVLFLIDWDTQYLPDALTQPLLWLGLMANAIGLWVPLDHALFGAIAGYWTFWLIAAIYKRVSGQDGMGEGDYKLCAALCAWLGLAALPWLMAIAAISSVAVTTVLVFSGRSTWRDPQAFGPHLIIAGTIYQIAILAPAW